MVRLAVPESDHQTVSSYYSDMIDPNHDRLKENRWLKALQLARILFDDEGYFTCYLDQIEEFIKNEHLEVNGPAFVFGIKNKEVTLVSSKCCEDCDDCQIFANNDAALLVIDLTTGHLSYSLDIGKPFPFYHARVTMCIEKEQILCKIERPTGNHDTVI